MNCPYCGALDSEVIETRDNEDGLATRRRRECLSCKKRFTTYERVENVDLVVIKRDGRREAFKREKVLTGILKATEKTKVSREDIDHILDEIEQELRGLDTIEVESKKIGMLVAGKLKKIDKVAYIRFASVFKKFVDADDFEEEIHKLIK